MTPHREDRRVAPLYVERVGVCAGGMADWSAARAVLAGERAFAWVTPPRLTPAALPATERRRANETSRWALQAAGEATGGLAAERVAALPTVFASADGDGEVLAQILRDLAASVVTVSPTTFHNSVYNAPGGYWSIAAQAPAASTTVCAAEASFAAGLLEAATQVNTTQGDVLLVAYDCPFPERSPIAAPARAAFSCALLLTAAPSRPLGRLDGIALGEGARSQLPAALDGAFAGNAAAIALHLLIAVARGVRARIALPYLDASTLAAQWSPCS